MLDDPALYLYSHRHGDLIKLITEGTGGTEGRKTRGGTEGPGVFMRDYVCDLLAVGINSKDYDSDVFKTWIQVLKILIVIYGRCFFEYPKVKLLYSIDVDKVLPSILSLRLLSVSQILKYKIKVSKLPLALLSLENE